MAELFLIDWCGIQVRVRNDDPHLSAYTATGQQVRCAMLLASDVEGLRLALTTILGRQYNVRVADDGSVVRLWRR
jgi:hypothetical protein